MPRDPTKNSYQFCRLLLVITLTSEEYQKKITRYCARPPSPFAVAASIRRSGYLSHGTAAHLHGPIEFSGPVYLNIEQSAKPPPVLGSLSRRTIDHAFADHPRHSNLSYRNGELVITQLAGKNTCRAGVEPATHRGLNT
jgi:hypothetical protein